MLELIKSGVRPRMGALFLYEAARSSSEIIKSQIPL